MSKEIFPEGTSNDVVVVKKVLSGELDIMDLHPDFIKEVFEDWVLVKEVEYGSSGCWAFRVGMEDTKVVGIKKPEHPNQWNKKYSSRYKYHH